MKSLSWFKIFAVVLLLLAVWFAWDAKNAAGGVAAQGSVFAFVDPSSAAGKPVFGTPIQASVFVFNNGGIPVFLNGVGNASVECGGKAVTPPVSASRGEKSLYLKDVATALGSGAVLVPGDYTVYSFNLPAVDAANAKASECEVVFKVFEDKADGEGFEKDFVLGVFPKQKTG